MTHDSRKANLIQVKLQLAEKYDHLASLTKSRPKRQKMKHRAEGYRRQAANTKVNKTK